MSPARRELRVGQLEVRRRRRALAGHPRERGFAYPAYARLVAQQVRGDREQPAARVAGPETPSGAVRAQERLRREVLCRTGVAQPVGEVAVHVGEVLLEQRAEGRRVAQIPHLRLITN
jgi:hypothetical protein